LELPLDLAFFLGDWMGLPLASTMGETSSSVTGLKPLI
jgi:hypothetical protein